MSGPGKESLKGYACCLLANWCQCVILRRMILRMLVSPRKSIAPRSSRPSGPPRPPRLTTKRFVLSSCPVVRAAALHRLSQGDRKTPDVLRLQRGRPAEEAELPLEQGEAGGGGDDPGGNHPVASVGGIMSEFRVFLIDDMPIYIGSYQQQNVDHCIRSCGSDDARMIPV